MYVEDFDEFQEQIDWGQRKYLFGIMAGGLWLKARGRDYEWQEIWMF